MTYCIVKGCQNSTRKNGRQSGVRLHVFPSTPERIKLWLQHIGKDIRDIDAFAQRVMDARKKHMFRICSIHFTPDSYVLDGEKLVLSKEAVPTIFPRRNLTVPEGGYPIQPAKKYCLERVPDQQSSMQGHEPIRWNVYPSTPPLVIPVLTTSSNFGVIHPKDNPSTLVKPKCEVKDAWTTMTKSIKMVDASTSTDDFYTTADKGVQWPEFEFNFEGELWKIQRDHFYPSRFCNQEKSAKANRMAARHQEQPFNIHPSVLTQQEDHLDFENAWSHQNSPFMDTTLREEKSRRHDVHCKSDGPMTGSIDTAKRERSETDIAQERKFLVFESCLDFLFYKVGCCFGNGCTAHITKIDKHVDGTFLSVTAQCHNGHLFHLWHSQPLLGSMAAGNVLMSAAVLFSGSNFCKVCDMSKVLGLQQISKSTYDTYQNLFLFPTIDLHWQQERMQLEEAFSNTQLTLAGDGQCKNATLFTKYCTYAFIDVATKRIVDFQIEEVPHTTSSVAIEKRAFKTCLDRLLSKNLRVKTIATDRRPGIKRIIHEKYHNLKHEYDVWHYARRVKKRLTAACKKKNCSKLASWIPTISHHLWWASFTSQGNTELLRERWQSLLPHSTDQHEWDSAKCFQACIHKRLTSDQHRLCPWLKKGTPAFHALREVVMSPQITKDLCHLSQMCHTGEIKAFHGFVSKYLPKGVHFKTNAVEARAKLAALAYNANVHRLVARKKYSRKERGAVGSGKHKLLFPQSRKLWVAKVVYTESSSEHVIPMMVDVLKKCSNKPIHHWNPWSATLPQDLASDPRHDKQRATSQHFSLVQTVREPPCGMYSLH
ncbi:uncharacterized protein WCC33_009287 [Rhinophrynus dorsalis]